jgi:hypothetical protein
MSRRVLLAVVVALPCCGAEPPPLDTGLATARAVHTATALAGGCVTDGCGTATDTTELYDPRTGRFSPGPSLTTARYKLPAAAALLPDGRVLVAGDDAAFVVVE